MFITNLFITTINYVLSLNHLSPTQQCLIIWDVFKGQIMTYTFMSHSQRFWFGHTTPLSSTSINVRWSPSQNSDRLPLTYHVNYIGMSRSTSDTTLTLTDLHPYEEYTISVQAGNEGGLSVPVTVTARTLFL